MSKTSTISDANATALREFNAAIFEDHDLDAVEEFFATDVVQYDSDTEIVRGLEESREYFEGMLEAFPDIELDVLELVADDDRAIMRFEATGTHEGDLSIGSQDGEATVAEATGKVVSWQGFVSALFDDGEMSEINLVSDKFGLAQRLGIIPASN